MNDIRTASPARLPLLIVWLLGSALAVIVALTSRDAAFLDGHYIPVGNDSFYHARRILDLIADPSSLHEFDRFIHYPEGSLLIWPWGYDYFMSLLVRAGLALHLSADPMAVLVHIPVFAFPVCIGLVVLISSQLRLSMAATVVTVLATVFFPLNQGLYGIGNIDHHFAEQLIVLASLACGLAWLGRPDSMIRACGTGALMGLALCIHNGLFIIQFPVAVVFLFWWVRGRAPPRNTWAFGAALMAATLLAAAPSTAFRQGSFQFYELSWFHVYFSTCVAVTCAFVSRFPRSGRNLAILLGAVVVMLIPVASQLLLADRFLSVSVEGAEQIAEVQSILAIGTTNHSIRAVTDLYTFLVLALPLAWLLCLFRAWKSTSADHALFWVTCLLGLAFMALMVRMHPFGSFALYFVWIVFVDELAREGRTSASVSRAALALLVLAACGPAIPGLFAPKIAGNDPYYALTFDIYPDLQRECARAPGVALSNLDDANYVRFHTNCTVIANNFLLTAFHESKVREARALLDTPATQLIARAPFVRYVLVHRQSLWSLDENRRVRFKPAGDPSLPDPRLVSDLIQADPAHLPTGFRLLKELAFEKPTHVVYARVFAIDAPASGRPTS